MSKPQPCNGDCRSRAFGKLNKLQRSDDTNRRIDAAIDQFGPGLGNGGFADHTLDAQPAQRGGKAAPSFTQPLFKTGRAPFGDAILRHGGREERVVT